MGDCIVLSATLQLGNAHGHQRLYTAEKFTHYLVGVGAVLVDFYTGVAALQAFHGQFDTRTVNSPTGNWQQKICSCAAGAGYSENTLFLTIKIQHSAALQGGKINSVGAVHTGLFVHSENDFQGRVGDGLVSKQRHSISHSNTVVTTQSGAFGKDPLTIVCDVQAFLIHINGAISVLVANHINVTLDNHRLMILHATGAFTEEQDIV